MAKYCECGCGAEVNCRFLRGHYARFNNPMNYEINRKNVSEGLKEAYKNGTKKPVCFGKGKTFVELYGKEKAEEIINKQKKTKKELFDSGILTGLKGDKNPSKRLDVRQKMSKKRKLLIEEKKVKCFSPGSLNPAFKDGKYKVIKYGSGFNNILKEKIKNKFNNECLVCAEKEGRICIHHIDYNKKNNSEENLVPLCIHCHMKLHRKEYIMQDMININLWGKYGISW